MTNREETLRTVGQTANLLGLSVRTLHHWEERGLVRPQGRSGANYRLYSDADIARLQQVMIYRATGMRLESIAALLDANEDAVAHLRRQRDLLSEKETELRQMVRAVNQLLEDAMGKKELSVEEVAEILGDASFPSHQVEAEQRWGDTDDWAISAQRTAQMTRGDWELTKEETSQVESALVEAMNRGIRPGSEEANELAEAHRALLSKFFPVSHSKHVLIACGYVDDPRFREYYESRGEGLAEWLKGIIDANAHANGVDPEAAVWE